jgi:hypothetical protein
LTFLALLGSAGLFAAKNDASQASLRTKAVDWIKTKAHYDADQEGFARILAQITKDIADEKYFTVALGADLMKSGKPNLAFGFAGEFFVFELSPKRAKKLKLQGADADYATAGGKRLDQRAPVSVAKLDALQINNADRLGLKKRLTGQAVCEPLKKSPGKYVLRLSYQLGGSWTHQFYPLKKLPKQKRPVRFSFNALGTGMGKKPFSGPVAVFLDVCTFTQKAGVTDIKIHSNTVGTLVDVVAKRAKK